MTQNKEESWEERFDKLFPELRGGLAMSDYTDEELVRITKGENPETKNRLKDFLRREIAQAREESYIKGFVDGSHSQDSKLNPTV